MINKKYLKILDTLGKEKQDVNENPNDKILIIDGLSVTAFANSIALEIPSTSVLPSGTCCTCHP